MRLFLRILAPFALALAFFAPAGAATAAPAEVIRDVAFVIDFNTCEGEFVVAQGTAHIVSKQQKDGSYIQHFQVHAKGTGNLGNEYVLNWSEQFKSDGFDYKFSGRQMAITKGSAQNQVINYSYDSTTNVFIVDPDCRG